MFGPKENMFETKKNGQPIVNQNIIGVLVAIAVLWYFFGGGLDSQVASNIQEIQNQVATDAVEQYLIASRNGSAMDRCVQAGFVTAAYLQAKDEVNYKKWKTLENNDCAIAGVPR